MTSEPAQSAPQVSKNFSPVLELFLLSLLALFLELFVIRWLSTEIRIFAYFKNLPLMSAFLGLGLGFIWAGKKQDFYEFSAFALLWLSGLLICAFKLGLTYLSFVDPAQFMLFGVSQGAEGLLSTMRSLLIMVLVFALSAFIFVGLGQRMGRIFNRLSPLKAYSVNVFGSLMGSILFSLLCYFCLSPAYWLAFAGVLFFLLDRRPVSAALILLAALYGFWLGPYISASTFGDVYTKTVWSPYYRIDVLKVKAPDGPYKGNVLGYNLYVNYDSFQSIVDCSPETLAKFPESVKKAMLAVQTEPFKVQSTPPHDVLILGSGSGSDVAAALRSGVSHVDAVEIDRSITLLGKELHPEKPYFSDKVNLYVTDARNYLKNCRKKYDVIVFAALDSHAAFSSLSSLRMDDYVFTVESLKEAYQLLRPGGLISINFVIPAEFLFERHAGALALAAGREPLLFKEKQEGATREGGLLFVGPSLSPEKVPERLAGRRQIRMKPACQTPPATDDWPFLFLPRREIPALYILPIFSVLLLSCIPVGMEFARGAGKILNWQMFVLGMAFMMLEVRAMADLSLLYGSTWVVNSVIISAVMIVILLANFLAGKLKVALVPFLLSVVILSLSLSSFVSAAEFSGMGPFLGGLCGSGLFLFPLVFAAMTFALLFRDAEDASSALAFNLIGGLLGVCLEYLSMSTGIRMLSWVGVLLYAIVLALQFQRKNGRLASD